MAWRMEGSCGLLPLSARSFSTTPTPVKQAASSWARANSAGGVLVATGLALSTWAACDTKAGQPFKWAGSKSKLLLDESDRGVPGGLLSAGLKRTGKASHTVDKDVSEESPFKESPSHHDKEHTPTERQVAEREDAHADAASAASAAGMVAVRRSSGWSLLLSIMRECWVPLVAVAAVTVGLATLTVSAGCVLRERTAKRIERGSDVVGDQGAEEAFSWVYTKRQNHYARFSQRRKIE